MTLLLSPLLVLLAGALLIWAASGRVRTYVLGLAVVVGLLGLAVLLQAAPQLGIPQQATLGWGTLDGVSQQVALSSAGIAGLFATLLLISGAFAAGGIASTLGRSTHAFGLVLSGLLVLLLGGLLTAYSGASLGALVGLGTAWLGSTLMQQTTAAHGPTATFSGLPALLLALALLGVAAAPTLTDDALTPGLWLAGCAVLIVGGSRWSTTRSAPALVRAPATALGMPLLGGYLLVAYATAAAPLWTRQLTSAVLLVGLAAFAVAALNALVARRLLDAFSWQLVAQLALIAVVFGSGNAAAGPIAAGLLGHTAVTTTALALAVGQLERTTRTEQFAALPPLPEPLRRAGLAYGLGALSAAGFPPLLGYTLRQTMLLLAPDRLWLTAVLLAASALLALSYLPTGVAFFRRPAFRSPLAAVEQRGGGWPLLLMLGLLLGGIIPDQIWQWLLGDPSTPQPIPPSAATLVETALAAALWLALLAIVTRALRRPRPAPLFSGGEPLDEEPGWTLPFAALPTVLAPLVIGDQLPAPGLRQLAADYRERLREPLRTVGRRYYLALVVISLISVLLLAAQ